jgi:hypothetical protein
VRNPMVASPFYSPDPFALRWNFFFFDWNWIPSSNQSDEITTTSVGVVVGWRL